MVTTMKMRNLKYFIGQGFSGLASNRMMSFASISIVTASIAIFGIFILFGINLNYISEQAIDGIEIQAFIDRGAEQAVIQNIGRQIEQIDGVREVIPYTAAEQLIIAQEMWADDPVILQRFENSNPFREGFRIFLADPNDASRIETQISRIDYVFNVNNDADDIQALVGFAGILRMISFWLVLILALVSIFIISNTIKLGMFSRRREINIMKYVGATNWFIRWPFIVEGIIIGCVGALIATGLILWGYGAIVSRIDGWLGMIDMVSVGDIYKNLILWLLLLGGGIGIIGSTLSIRKHLIV